MLLCLVTNLAGNNIMVPFWFLIFIFFAIAIVLANFRLWVIVIVLSSALILLGTCSRKYTREAFTSVIVLLAGILYYSIVTLPAPESLPIFTQAEIEGIVINYPRYDGQKTDFIVTTENKNGYLHRIRVYCSFSTSLQKGDEVILRGSLKPPARPGNPGEFDYQKYLEQNGIYYILSVREEKDLQIKAPAYGMQALMNSYRCRSQELIKEVLPADDAAIMLGMLLGIIEGINSDEYSDYQKTGIVHIFSVSGLHVGFLLVLCAWICSLLELSKKVRIVSGITLLIVYASLVGWPVPVIRSVIMGSMGLIAYYSGRENQLINSLGLAGIFILIINPLSLLQISFQLSFAAAWGLVFLFPLLKQKLNYNNHWGDLLLVPICAQLAVLPLTAYHFNLFSPLSLLANIPVTYLGAGTVILGFLTITSGVLVPGLSILLLCPAGLFINLIQLVNQIVVEVPGAYLRVATPGLVMVAIYYAGLLLTICAISSKLKKEQAKVLMALGTVMVLFFCIVLCLPGNVYNRGKLELVFIDVGQGDSILIKTPQGKFILVDGGGSDFTDIGSRKVLPFLYHRGVRELFLAINTHPDTDHLLGIEKVLNELPVKYILLPDSLDESEKYQNLKKVAQKQQVAIIPASAGNQVDTGENIELKILHPQTGYKSDDANNQSLVLYIRYGNFSALLTGDIDTQVMQELIDNYQLGPISVLKVPHHGSKSSLLSTFYDETRARWAVISVGANNLFGHPHSSIIKALKERSINILRTDQEGAIMFSSDGKTVKVKTSIANISH
jgi:competence protein ComEC